MASIPRWRQKIVEIVCMFEKELSVSFMDLQVHLLIHLPNEVELARVVSCHYMLFLGRYMKHLRGLFDKWKMARGCRERISKVASIKDDKV